MISRNLETRVVKLEAIRQRPDEILLVWRRPDTDVPKSLTGAQYSPGDKVLCAEWFGNGPLPEPRWYRGRLMNAIDDDGLDSLTASIKRIADGQHPSAIGAPLAPSQRLTAMSDNELLHAALGVAT